MSSMLMYFKTLKTSMFKIYVFLFRKNWPKYRWLILYYTDFCPIKCSSEWECLWWLACLQLASSKSWLMAVMQPRLFKQALWNTSTQEKQTARFWTEGILLRKHLCCNARQSVITLIQFKYPYLWLMSCERVRSVIDYHAPTGQAFKWPAYCSWKVSKRSLSSIWI